MLKVNSLYKVISNREFIWISSDDGARMDFSNEEQYTKEQFKASLGRLKSFNPSFAGDKIFIVSFKSLYKFNNISEFRIYECFLIQTNRYFYVPLLRNDFLEELDPNILFSDFEEIK